MQIKELAMQMKELVPCMHPNQGASSRHAFKSKSCTVLDPVHASKSRSGLGHRQNLCTPLHTHAHTYVHTRTTTHARSYRHIRSNTHTRMHTRIRTQAAETSNRVWRQEVPALNLTAVGLDMQPPMFSKLGGVW